MSTVPLPETPSFEQLRNQAKDLRRAVLAGEDDAVAEVGARHPDGAPATGEPFPLRSAQLVVARRYGFASWTRLKRHLEVVERYQRAPDDIETLANPADELIRLACLTYGIDEPERREQARRLLAGRPDLAGATIYTAAVAADVEQVRRFLRDDPGLARAEGGPHRWTALFHLAYSRLDDAVDREAVLVVAATLLDHGADPNAGYLWHGLPIPFTVLTGVFGEGEQGPVHQSRHPHSPAFARLLLERGADPNDGQTLYNRMFGTDDDHLELLFEFGLGAGDGGPWRARLGDAIESPAAMLQRQLEWAVTHDQRARVRLLAEHGVDLDARLPNGRTAAELAVLNGNTSIADDLIVLGAAPPALAPVDAFVAAVLGADADAVERLRASQPGVVAEAQDARPGLVVWAAANGRRDAVDLLVALGFDVNALGRGDAPVEEPWETALHRAAGDGDVALVELLLALGADRSIRDARFDATPLQWAGYFGQGSVVTVLEPVTPDGQSG
jgi:hypothetical protein